MMMSQHILLSLFVSIHYSYIHLSESLSASVAGAGCLVTLCAGQGEVPEGGEEGGGGIIGGESKS